MIYLIPEPQIMTEKEGFYTFGYDEKIVLDPTCPKEGYRYAKLLQEELKRSTGYAPAITRGRSVKTAALLKIDSGLENGAQAYTLSVTERGIEITGQSRVGLLYGVQTLRQVIRQAGACIPFMEITDYPSIANRGVYFDVTRGRIPTLDYMKKQADTLAFYKMNQMQLYIEHTYLFEGLSEMWRDDTPLSAEDILELDAYCRDLNIELVPSLSCFGHLYKLLRTKSYRHLCELPGTDGEPFGFYDRMAHHTIDVTNPESMELIQHLIEEYMPLFTSKHFNIGADETFDLGKGKSRELAQKIGIERVYLDFVKQLCEFVISKGKIPMFWGDIICSFPEAIRELPPETICLNWGYDPNVTEDSTRALANAGATQYTCPGVQGWNQLVNDIRGSYENIRRMCAYARKYGAVGVLTTDWGDYGHINHPDFGVTGIIYGAAFTWNERIPELEEINRRISRVEFQDRTETLVSVLMGVSDAWVYKWFDAVVYREKNSGAFTPEKIAGAAKALEELQVITEKLYQILPQLGESARVRIYPYLVAVRGVRLLQYLGAALTAKEYAAKPVVPVNEKELAAEFEEWFRIYKEIWRSVSRESELYRLQEWVNWCADLLREM